MAGLLLTLPAAASAVAVANVNPPTVTVEPFAPTSQPLVGSTVTTTVTFDNGDPTRTGFGPYIEVLYNSRGDDDGDGGKDGLTLLSATMTAATLTTHSIDCDLVTLPTPHPYHRDSALQLAPKYMLTPADCPAGHTLLVAHLPFGSFTAAQPPAEIELAFQVSPNFDVSGPLGVEVRGGYRFGGDALDNATMDEAIRGNAAAVNDRTASVTPTVMKLHKEYIGPEHETATGPSFPRQFKLDLDVATGHQVNGVTLQDNLPPNIVVTGVTASSGGTVSSPAFQAASLPARVGASPANALTVTWAGITGTAGVDRTVTVDFYVPYESGGGTSLLPGASDLDFDNPTGGVVNASGTWVPIDPLDTGTVVTTTFSDDTGAALTETFHGDSIVIQKAYTGTVTDAAPTGLSPGDVLAFRISGQISDYYAMNNIVVTDTLRDGLRRDVSFVPTITLNGQQATSGTFTGANIVDASGVDDTATFNVSGALGLGSPVLGGCVPAGGLADTSALEGIGACGPASATTFTITYRVIVDDNYVGFGGAPIRAGDTLSNDAVVHAEALAPNTGLPAIGPVGDDTSESIEISRGSVAKKVYAVNGAPVVGPGEVLVRPNDLVTYHVKFEMPFATVKGLVIDDFLPLPVHDASTVATLDLVKDNAIPAEGHVRFVNGIAGLEDDTFSGPAGLLGQWPTLTQNGPTTGNFFRLAYPDNNLITSAGVVSFLVTVRANNLPFADEMLLTNQVEVRTSNNPGTIVDKDAYANIRLREPNVEVHKGITATTNANAVFSPTSALPDGAGVGTPGVAPAVSGITAMNAPAIDSNVSNLDAHDIVRYTVTYANTGGARATNLRICDTLPEEFANPSMYLPGATNLTVTYGNGAPVAYSGADYFNCAGGGLLVTDIVNGVEQGDAYTPGTDVIVVTYDRTVNASAQPALTDVLNTGVLRQFTNVGSAEGFLDDDEPLRDTAIARAEVNPTVTKLITDSSAAHTAAHDQPTVGESVQYTVTTTLREGTLENFQLRDVLPNGLLLAATPAPVITLGANVTAATPSPAVTTGGTGNRTLTWSFGNVTNNNNSGNNAADTITIVYWAVVRDVTGTPNNVHGQNRDNAVTALHDDCGAAPLATCATATDRLTIREPQTTINKGVSATEAGAPTGSIDLDSHDSAWWTIDVANAAGRPTAFDAIVTDTIPGGLLYQAGTLAITGPGIVGSATCAPGAPGVLVNFTGGTCQWTSSSAFTVAFDAVHAGPANAYRIKYHTVIDPASARTGVQLTNTGTLSYRSLDTGTGQACVPADATCRERTYTGADDADVTINMAPPTKTRISTSAPDSITSGTSVVIGERATYRVSFVVPEGLTSKLRVIDTLDAGLVFTQTPVSITHDFNAAPAPLPASITPTFNGAGNVMTLNFGDFQNNDDDGNAETITIEYEVQVTDVAANVQGTTLGNGVRVLFEPPTGPPDVELAPVTPPADLVVQEPVVQITKTMAREDIAGQSYVRVELRAINPAGSPVDAFDVHLEDDLAGTNLTYVATPAWTCTGMTGTCTPAQSAGVVSADITRLNVGETAVFTYYTQVASGYIVGTTISNSADVEWTTLPPAEHPSGNCVAGVPATECRERTEDDTTTATLTPLTPSMTKSLVATSQSHTATPTVAVGEVVEYRVVVTVPEGVTQSLIVTDTLDTGLALVAGSFSVTGASDGGLTDLSGSTPVFTNDGRTFTYTFGNVTNADRDANAETITIGYQAFVTNTAAVNTGSSLGNTASGSWQPPLGPPATIVPPTLPDDVVVAEPGIDVTKAMSRVNIGGVNYVRIVVTAQNTGAIAGFDVDLRDDLNGRHLTYVNTPAAVAPTCSMDGGTAYTCATSAAGNIAAADIDRLDPSQTVTWTFYTTQNETAVAGVDLTNEVRGELTSTPLTPAATCVAGTPAGICTERTGSDTPAHNDHHDEAPATLAALEPSITKSLTGSSLASTTPHTEPTVGERVQYTTVVTVPAGTTRGLRVVDTLDPALGFAADAGATEVTISSSWATGTPADPATAPVFSTLAGPPAQHVMTLDFANIVNNTGVNQTVTITYWAVVRNNANVNRGTTADNGVQLYRNANETGGTTTLVPGPGGSDNAGPITVVEPELDITKTITPGLVDAGQPATVTLTIQHTAASDAVAHGVVVNDPLPTTPNGGMVRTAAPITCTDDAAPTPNPVTCDTSGSAGQLVNVQISSIAVGDVVVITIPVTMSATLAAGDSVSNTGYVDWRSQPDLPGVDTACAAGFADCESRTGDYTDPTEPVDDYTDNSTAVTTGATTSTISGHVWHDVNNDGVRDGGEPIIGGVTITLTGTDLLGNAVNLTTTTAAGTGYYEFTGLRPGTYQVTQTQPTGWIDGKEGSLNAITSTTPPFTVGTASAGSATANDRFTGIMLPIGHSSAVTQVDFGELRPASISGRVWGEQNGGPEDGVRDGAVDTDLSGVTITLTGTDDNGDPVELSTTTNASGQYAFENLRPGTYTVTQTQPGGWANPDGGLGALPGTGTTGAGTANGPNVIESIVLRQDEDGVAYDFWEVVRVNVAVTKDLVPAAAGDIVGIGTTFTWRIRVTNTGPSPATGIDVADTMQTLAREHLTVTAVTPQAGTTCAPWDEAATPNLACTVAALAPGASTTIDLTVRVDSKPAVAPEDLVNDVRITDVDQEDTDPTDNEDTDRVISRGGDVGVVKTGNATRLMVGQQITWTLRVTNHGPGTDPDVRLRDQLPPRAVLVSATPAVGTCTPTGVQGATIDCALGAMVAGQQIDVTVVAMTPVAGTYRNTVTVIPGGVDENPTNNDDEHTVIVNVPGIADCTIEASGNITGSGGADVICGSDGDDVIECGPTGDTIIIAGGGNNTITCMPTDCSVNVSIIGGNGTDVIRVGCGNVVVDGGGGNDTIVATNGSGPVVLCGGDGNDVIRGGRRGDLLDGGRGNDRIFGNGGNDRLYGGLGNDQIKGGTGNDRIYGGSGRDRLWGDAGNDLIFGEAGNDRIWGGVGRDRAHGGNGNDTFNMRDRNRDIVIGGRGRDTIIRDTRLDRWTSVERIR